jgi:hypothetical protein
MWGEKAKVLGFSMQIIRNTDYDRLKTAGKCGIFKLFWVT